MGAEPIGVQSETSQVEGLKNLMIGDPHLKQAAAPETPPRADDAMDVCHNPADGPQREDGPQRDDSDGKMWQALPRQYELSDFQPLKKLYRGYASKVYLAEDVGKLKNQQGGVQRIKDPKEQQKVVLKVYDLLRLSPLTKYQLDREIKIHSSISHRNIVRLEAAFTQVWRLSLRFYLCQQIIYKLWLSIAIRTEGLHSCRQTSQFLCKTMPSMGTYTRFCTSSGPSSQSAGSFRASSCLAWMHCPTCMPATLHIGTLSLKICCWMLTTKSCWRTLGCQCVSLKRMRSHGQEQWTTWPQRSLCVRSSGCQQITRTEKTSHTR